MNYFSQRRQTLAQFLKRDGLDAVLITSDVNVYYFTAFTGDSSYFITTAKNSIIVSDDRFEGQLREECGDIYNAERDKDRERPNPIDLHIRPHNKTTLEAAVEVLHKTGARTVGVEANRLTFAELETLKSLSTKLEFVPIANLVEKMRVVKDPSEIDRIRDAVHVAERAFRMFMATLREADTEKDMVDAMESYVRRAGGRKTSFPPIVAVGERGALPHAPPTNRQLGEGSKLLVDWGADLIYKSDITRTIRSPFGTAPTRRNKMERVGYDFDRIYQVVLDAQNAALSTLRHGVHAKDVDAAARKVFAEAKFKDAPDLRLDEYFTHGLGHGIGLEMHEAPRIRANSDDILEAGMVVTIEPGVYIPGWGGVRIEDDVLITRDGCTLLTSLPRELPPLD